MSLGAQIPKYCVLESVANQELKPKINNTKYLYELENFLAWLSDIFCVRIRDFIQFMNSFLWMSGSDPIPFYKAVSGLSIGI